MIYQEGYSMKRLIIALFLCYSVTALAVDQRFVFHMGFHRPLGAAAYAAATAATGDSGINVNCSADDANQWLIAGVSVLAVICLYQLFKKDAVVHVNCACQK